MYPSDLFRSLVVRSRNDSGGISFNKGYFGVVIPFDKKSVKQFGRKVMIDRCLNFINDLFSYSSPAIVLVANWMEDVVVMNLLGILFCYIIFGQTI